MHHLDARGVKQPFEGETGPLFPRREHRQYLKYRKTGMEPWFQFWEAVRDSIKQIRKEWEEHKAYMRGVHP
jgi:hypothetical protein